MIALSSGLFSLSKLLGRRQISEYAPVPADKKREALALCVAQGLFFLRNLRSESDFDFKGLNIR
jgi:hypothetical protein